MVKHRVTLCVDWGLWAEATARGTNMSQLMNDALRVLVGEEYSYESIPEIEAKLEKLKIVQETRHSYESDLKVLHDRWMKGGRSRFNELSNRYWIKGQIKGKPYLLRYSISDLRTRLEAMTAEMAENEEKEGSR